MSIKSKLYNACELHIDQRIALIRHEIHETQNSANLETKSSAGDKYETGRAMLQLEKEKLLNQLNEALKTKKNLNLIDPFKQQETIQPGSLVITSAGSYFISISAGMVHLDGETYYAISLASPLGKQLHQRKAGDEVYFNKQAIKILKVI